MRVECPRQPGDRGRQREGLELKPQHGLASEARQFRVLPHRPQCPAVWRAVQPAQPPQQQHDDGAGHRQVEQVEPGQAQHRLQRCRDARHAVRASGQPALVYRHQADHLPEPQRHDRQVVVPQPQRREGDDDPGQHPRGQGRDQAHDERRTGAGDDRRSVCAHGEEPGQTQIHHPRPAPGQVQAERQHGEDAARNQGGNGVGQHQAARSPSSPRGQKVSISRMAANPMALR